MSDIIEMNRADYVTLIKQFMSGEISGATFQKTFLDKWRRNRDEAYARVNTGGERPDIRLLNAFQRGELSESEFNKKWQELWGYKPSLWLTVFERLFRDVERFEPDPVRLKESKNDSVQYNAEYCISENELKSRLQDYLIELGETS